MVKPISSPPCPPPAPTLAPPPHHPQSHHRYPQPPPHHHRHPPRSRPPAYYHSRIPSPPPIATASSPATASRSPYASQTIHPALVTPQTPHGPPSQPPPPISRPPPSSKVPATPSSLPVTHTPHAQDPTIACADSNLVTAKPPRPYTEYTMFYQLEREYILHRLLVDKNDPQAATHQEQQTQEALFKDDPLMPQRYRTLPLRADWYISGKSKKPSKRKHRKTHGKIGFLELTRMIAARWANVDEETRTYCKMMAAMELVKYKEDVESYNVYKARLEKMGEVPDDLKERERKKKKAKDKKTKDKSDAGSTSAGTPTDVMTCVGDGKARNVMADCVKSDETLSSSSTQLLRDASQDNVDKDMEQFITSLVRDDGHVHDDQRRGDRKRPPYRRPPLPPSNSTRLYTENHHAASHYEAPWNHIMPGPREDRRGAMSMHPPPPAAAAQDAASSSTVITPERSFKRRRLPVPSNAPTDGTTTTAYSIPSHPSEATTAAMINNGPVSPDDDELIHMAFSGIDESEIAREFYFPNHATDSRDVAETAGQPAASMPGEASLPRTEELYGPPLQSFDYWDALMEPTANQGGGGEGSDML
ncbi:hypothetical protein ACHAWX_005290 [Stephanocyclus meneghinianus]